MATRAPLEGTAPLRWHRADEPSAQGALFERVHREVGHGEFRGMEFLEVEAKRLINEVKGADRSWLPFRYTINPYRGCSHACTYCLAGETPIWTADGRSKPIADLRTGDLLYGTERRGSYRRYVVTEVLDHWATSKPAYRVHLADGTVLVASGDHRFLSERGWKHVADAAVGQRPHLTTNNSLLGLGRMPEPPKDDGDYRRGYLAGMVRGDGHLGTYVYKGRRPAPEVAHRFRLALIDDEGLDRAERYLTQFGLPLWRRVFQRATDTRAEVRCIGSNAQVTVDGVRQLIEWPTDPSASWQKGYLAGLFDAEGSNGGVVRFANTDPELLEVADAALQHFGFHTTYDEPARSNGLRYLRIRGGQREVQRFFHLVDPAITRKRSLDGLALKSDAELRVVAIEPLGIEIPMYDITTGTGDFVANGVVSHNCYARPTHEYLGLGIGADFDQRVVVKVNAVERVRAELHPARWAGDLVAMGTNTDPYQRCEGKYRLTRGIIGALIEARNPFSILTKSTLVLRDVDLLVKASRITDVRVNLSIGTLDEDVWRLTEPGTPHPRRRLRAVEQLNEAGVECGVLVAPILPGLSDRTDQLEAVAEACVEAGAASVSTVLLHLRPGVREHYLGELAQHRPDLVARYERQYRGANAPKADRQRVQAIVHGAVRRAGGRSAEGRAAEHLVGRGGRSAPEVPVADPAGPSSSEQLRLGV